MSEYIKLTWSKLAIILISIAIFVIGWAYCDTHLINKKTIAIELGEIQDDARAKTQD